MTAAGTDAFFAGGDAARLGPAWQAPAGVCPAIHERLERRRAAAAVARAAARRLRTLADTLAQSAGQWSHH